MWDVQQLFRSYNGELKRYLRRRGASAETAADLTQETFLRLLTAAPLGPVDNVQAYIFRTANNLSIDLVRRQRLLPFLDNGEEVLDRLVDEAPSPERVVVSRQELAILQAALNQVPEKPRSVSWRGWMDKPSRKSAGLSASRPRPHSARCSGS